MKTARETGVAGRQALRLPVLRMSLSTVYAWSRILAAYAQRHPQHQVRVFYHGHPVQDLRMLVRQAPQLDAAGFEVRVQSADGTSREVVVLLQLMEQAAGPAMHTFLTADDPNLWFLDPLTLGQSGSRPTARR